MSDNETTYDELPYSNHTFFQTHPAHLATVAALHGVDTPDVATCRVLELGCGLGGNLLPMAEALPNARFVGIDLSRLQIELGQADVRELGLANVELRTLSITDLDPSFGQFDYIICHGVYSWVPPEVQAKILHICRDNLAANGVAYISYNAYPGWHFRGILREFAHFHVDRSASIPQQLQQLSELIKFAHDGMANREGMRTQVLRDEAADLMSSDPRYVFHEILESYNEPVYFHEFARRLAGARLQYVAETTMTPLVASLAGAVKQTADRWSSSRVQREQYDDFLTHRTFRRSLITHAAATVSGTPSWQAVQRFQLSAFAEPRGEANLDAGAAAEFANPRNVTITVDHPLVKAFLLSLHQARPRSLAFFELAERCAAALHWDQAKVCAELPQALIACYEREMVEWSLYSATFVNQISERPCVSPLVRQQARAGSRPTNRRHRRFEFDALMTFLLPFIDGTRTPAQLTDLLCTRVQSGELGIQTDQGEPLPAEEVRAYCANAIAKFLQTLADNAFLIA